MLIGYIAALAYALAAFASLLVAAILTSSPIAAVCVGLSAGAAYVFQVLEQMIEDPRVLYPLWALSLILYLLAAGLVAFKAI